jgi:AcrR family transcriptional regulator
MPRDAADTRAALLEAGRHLFATEGVYAVPLASIIKAAGQYNSSVVHYHFAFDGLDARTGLLLTIVAMEDASIEVERQLMMNIIRNEGRLDNIPELVRAVIIPMVPKFRDTAGREYLAIISQMLDHFNNWDAHGPRMPGSAFEVFDAIQNALSMDLPPLVRRERVVRFLELAVEALGSHARYLSSLETQPPNPKRLDTRDFVENLIDMAVGALTAPRLSESTAPDPGQQ